MAQVTPASSATHSMREEADGDLLYYMSCRERAADCALSDAATREFYRRHARRLLDRCSTICRQFGSVVDPEQLFEATLAKAIAHADTFVAGVDAAKQAARTLGWLGRIARNLHVDTLRNPYRAGLLTGDQERIPIEDYSTEEIAALYCDGRAMPRDLATIRLVQEALLTLDDRARRVISHTVLQRQRSPGRSYVFRGEMKALADELDTTTANLRRIRSISVKAIAQYVQAHLGQV